jgi:hypothetical protein
MRFVLSAAERYLPMSFWMAQEHQGRIDTRTEAPVAEMCKVQE